MMTWQEIDKEVTKARNQQRSNLTHSYFCADEIVWKVCIHSIVICVHVYTAHVL